MAIADSNNDKDNDQSSDPVKPGIPDAVPPSTEAEEENMNFDALLVPLAAKFRWWHVLVAVTSLVLVIWAFPVSLNQNRFLIVICLTLFAAIGFYIFNAKYPTQAEKNECFAFYFYLLLASTLFKSCSPESNVPYITLDPPHRRPFSTMDSRHKSPLPLERTSPPVQNDKNGPSVRVNSLNGDETTEFKVDQTDRLLNELHIILPDEYGITEPTVDQRGQRQQTANYWTQTVADLHSTRFQITDETEPSHQYYQRFIKQMQQKLVKARQASSANVDTALTEMVARHLALDQEIVEALSEIQSLIARREIPDNTIPVRETIQKAWEFYEQFATDPAMLNQIDDQEIRRLVERLFKMHEAQLEQFYEIEQMQAQLQARYRPASFSLPEID